MDCLFPPLLLINGENTFPQAVKGGWHEIALKPWEFLELFQWTGPGGDDQKQEEQLENSHSLTLNRKGKEIPCQRKPDSPGQKVAEPPALFQVESLSGF